MQVVPAGSAEVGVSVIVWPGEPLTVNACCEDAGHAERERARPRRHAFAERDGDLGVRGDADRRHAAGWLPVTIGALSAATTESLSSDGRHLPRLETERRRPPSPGRAEGERAAERRQPEKVRLGCDRAQLRALATRRTDPSPLTQTKISPAGSRAALARPAAGERADVAQDAAALRRADVLERRRRTGETREVGAGAAACGQRCRDDDAGGEQRNGRSDDAAPADRTRRPTAWVSSGAPDCRATSPGRIIEPLVGDRSSLLG